MNYGMDDLYGQLNAFQQENEQLKQQVQAVQQGSVYAGQNQDDLVRFQLMLSDILETAEHLLRGDKVLTDVDGNVSWAEPDEEDLRLFNEKGVQAILRILHSYLNRNTILANYEVQEIKDIVYDFGHNVNKYIYSNYEKMGLDTIEKIKVYPTILNSIKDMVHSAYTRAYNGGERQSLREARHVSQSLTPQGYGMPQFMPQQRRFSLLKPTTWFRK